MKSKIILMLFLFLFIVLSIVTCFLSRDYIMAKNADKGDEPGISVLSPLPGNPEEGGLSGAQPDYAAASALLSEKCGRQISERILRNLSANEINALTAECRKDEFDESIWREVTGYSFNALNDVYDTRESKIMGNEGKKEKESITLGFTGDINFTVSGYVMTHASNMPNGPIDCIDDVFIDEMKNADIMLVNNEFPYSDRGEPIKDKKYTFRARPETVQYMNYFGVDIVSLANNHAYDYGPEAFEDTLSILDNAGICRVGAGKNRAEASKPVSFIVNGCKVSYLAACGVESPIKTPVAGENSEGIMGSYDDGNALCEQIRKAKLNSDYVIVFPHWGIENTTELTGAQRENSKKYINAGADAVIGCHPHILQGFEFYNNVPIAYSLGNFWFNTKDVYTVLLKLVIDDSSVKTVIVPGRQRNSETRYLSSSDEQAYLYRDLERISPASGVSIDENGVITPRQ